METTDAQVVVAGRQTSTGWGSTQGDAERTIGTGRREDLQISRRPEPPKTTGKGHAQRP